MKSFNKRTTAVEGIRVGLKAFIMTYATAFLISVVINLSVIEKIQDYLQGTLSGDVGFDFGVVIKVTSVIMNASVFNASGTIQLGLLVLGILPLFAFYLADRGDNKKEGMDLVGFMIYGVASAVFTLLLAAVSLLTKGELMGMAVNFVSLRNGLMTFVITFLIQVAIGMNYNMNRLPGVLATRWMVRGSFSLTALLSVIGLIALIIPYSRSSSLLLLAIFVLGPNVAAYLFFMLFGVSLNLNDALSKLLAFVNVDVSYGAIPVWGRALMMAMFLGLILIALTRIDKAHFVKGVLGFGCVFSLISLLVAYCTVIDLGVVRGIVDIRLSISPVMAWAYPFMAVLLMGGLYEASRRLMAVIKTND